MAATSVGLYIGVDTAEWVVLRGSFHSPRITGWGRIPIPSGPWRSQFQAKESEPLSEFPKETTSPLASADDIARVITTLLKDTHLPTSCIHVAAVPESVIIRYFQMPMIPSRERRTAVSYEAKKYLPFKVADLITDFHVVTHRSDPALMRVMFFGIKKSTSMTYQMLLKSAGLTPLCLEPPVLSLMRLMRQSGQSFTTQAYTILSVEPSTATISIARDDLLYLSRNVGISPSSGSPPGHSPELMEALIHETRVSIDYYRRRFLGEPAIQKVILFGKEATPHQTDELSTALELPVELGDPFKRMGATKEVPAVLAVALGLALRGLEKRGPQANLLPLEARREPRDLLRPLAIPSAVAFGLLCLGSAVSWLDLNTHRQKVAEERQQQIFPAGVTPEMTLDELSRFRSEKQRQLRFLQELSPVPEKQAHLLSEMTALLPPEAWVEQIALTDTLKSVGLASPLEVKHRRVIVLNGKAYTGYRDKEIEGINRFLADLRASALFASQFTEFHLDSVERKTFYEELEVTEFNLSGALDREDLPEGSNRSRLRGSLRRYLP